MLERIQRDGGVSVAELARSYAVSPITVHRDLEQLAREGLVERVHGGARALAQPEPVTARAIATAKLRMRLGEADRLVIAGQDCTGNS